MRQDNLLARAIDSANPQCGGCGFGICRCDKDVPAPAPPSKIDNLKAALDSLGAAIADRELQRMRAAEACKRRDNACQDVVVKRALFDTALAEFVAAVGELGK